MDGDRTQHRTVDWAMFRAQKRGQAGEDAPSRGQQQNMSLFILNKTYYKMMAWVDSNYSISGYIVQHLILVDLTLPDNRLHDMFKELAQQS